MLKDVINTCLSFGTQYYMLSQVVEALGLEWKSVRHKLWKLEAAGLITRVKSRAIPLPDFSKGRPHKNIMYRNTKLLTKKAESPRTHKENGWDKMWQAIRALRRFTRHELASLCEQSIANVIFFTKTYRKLGYIQSTRKSGRNVVWIVIKDPGAKRPLK
jgi:hypothetical protein